MEEQTFGLTLTQGEGYSYTVTFDDPSFAALHLDEPPPLGEGRGPNAVRILAAAVGNCLSASLQYCLTRAHVATLGMVTRVEGTLHRNAQGRMRVGELRVFLQPTLAQESHARLLRCMDVFEDFCVVTESVRSGIDVLVEVQPRVPVEEPAEALGAVQPASG